MKLFLVSLVFLSSIAAFGCCAESNYRIFPLGEVNNNMVFVEFNLFRRCEGGTGAGENNEFWISGVINLVSYENDSIVIIENIDTINVKECVCIYKNQYEKSEFEVVLKKYYTIALNKVKSKDRVVPKHITFNDTINAKTRKTDTSYRFYYKNLININLDSAITSCETDQVMEVREYETEHYKIIIIRLSCRSSSKEAIIRNSKRFRSVKTAFWKDKALWHGTLNDYVFVELKQG